MDKRKILIGAGAVIVILIAVSVMRRSGAAAAESDPGGYVANTLPIYGGANVVATSPVSTQPIGGNTIADLQSAINAGEAAAQSAATDRARINRAGKAFNQLLAAGRNLIGPRVGGASKITAESTLRESGAGGNNVISITSRLNTKLTDKHVAPPRNVGYRPPTIQLAPITVKNKVDGGLF